MATYKVQKADGEIINVYEAKSAAAASKQHLETLGHQVSVASSGEVFSFLRGQKDMFRDNQGPVGVEPTVT